MNSQQRRRDRRLWQYSVRITARSYDQYNAMWMWLKAKHTSKAYRCGWRDRVDLVWDTDLNDEVYDIRWQFLKQQDAVEFALRWSGQ